MRHVRLTARLGALGSLAALGLSACLILSGCASNPKPQGTTAALAAVPPKPDAPAELEVQPSAPQDLSPAHELVPAAKGENDPFEKFNRRVFAFDLSLDKHIMRPIAIFYRDTLPDPFKDGIHHFLVNLDMPVTIANDLLQARPKRFIQAVGRVGVNSVLGIGGFVDVATKFGIPNETADFGQTLGIYGAGEGPYLVIPFVGPKPPRDLAGDIVDLFFDPFNYINFREKGSWMGARAALGLIDDRTQQLGTVDKIQESSIDFYASVRNLYRQDRNAKINGRDALENLPDF